MFFWSKLNFWTKNVLYPGVVFPPINLDAAKELKSFSHHFHKARLWEKYRVSKREIATGKLAREGFDGILVIDMVMAAPEKLYGN